MRRKTNSKRAPFLTMAFCGTMGATSGCLPYVCNVHGKSKQAVPKIEKTICGRSFWWLGKHVKSESVQPPSPLQAQFFKNLFTLTKSCSVCFRSFSLYSSLKSSYSSRLFKIILCIRLKISLCHGCSWVSDYLTVLINDGGLGLHWSTFWDVRFCCPLSLLVGLKNAD